MYLGNQPALSYTSFAKQDFTTSATTSYALSQPVANENEIALFINFVRQEPTTAYTASGTSLTLTSATSASDDMYAIFLGKAVQTVNPPAGSVNLDKIDSTAKSFLTRNYRNIIINGDMSIAQRGTTATGLGNGDSGYHTCDRWRFNEAGAPTFEFTMSQDTDVPTGQGFSSSLKMDCTTADTSLAAGDNLTFQTRFEGQNLQYLKKGTSSAESLTLSFWVKSNKTGTYIAELFDNDNTRQISKSYTIDTTDTWEKKTITFARDTTGTFDNDNAASLIVGWFLGAGTDFSSGTLNTTWNSNTNANRAVGQVNLADSTANEWYITGVQLEAGTTASDFEFLPVDVNEQRCFRYYWKYAEGYAIHFGTASCYGTSQLVAFIAPSVKLRATPSLELVSGTNFFRLYSNGLFQFNGFALTGGQTGNAISIYADGSHGVSGLTGGYAGYLLTLDASCKIAFSAEL